MFYTVKTIMSPSGRHCCCYVNGNEGERPKEGIVYPKEGGVLELRVFDELEEALFCVEEWYNTRVWESFLRIDNNKQIIAYRPTMGGGEKK